MRKVVETQIEGKLLEHQEPDPPPYSKVDIQEDTKETNREDNLPLDHEGEEMEIGDLDLESLEAACCKKVPETIPPQQVTLLEKAIINAKTMKFMGIMSDSLKDPDGIKKGKKEKR